jgi:hypothetical protein
MALERGEAFSDARGASSAKAREQGNGRTEGGRREGIVFGLVASRSTIGTSTRGRGDRAAGRDDAPKPTSWNVFVALACTPICKFAFEFPKVCSVGTKDGGRQRRRRRRARRVRFRFAKLYADGRDAILDGATTGDGRRRRTRLGSTPRSRSAPCRTPSSRPGRRLRDDEGRGRTGRSERIRF